MATQASWGSHKFTISSSQVNALNSLSISDSYNDDFDSNGKRIGLEPTTFNIETVLNTAVLGKGKYARTEMQKWRSAIGKYAYFYLGGTKLFTRQYKLLKVDSSDFVLDNKGRTLSVKLTLSFKIKPTAAQDRAAAKAAKSSATTTTTSTTKKGAAVTGKQNKTTAWDGGRMSWPCPGHKTITSNYGPRICPYHGRETHSGIDIGAGTGSTIVAAAAGTVVLSGYYGGYGKCVIINHGKGVYTLYGHCSSLLVGKGAKVKEGQKIAKVGSTGNSTGPHLHFEVRKGGNSSGKHTSPWKYVKK